MQFFRIRIGDNGNHVVEPYLEWQRLDGTAYIPVGGTSLPYLSVSKLFEPTERTGRVMTGDFRARETGGLELIPQGKFGRNAAGEETFVPASDSTDDRAFVVIPSGAYDFQFHPGMSPHSPRDHTAARILVLNPGDTVRAMPKVNSIREMERVGARVLTYHGCGRLTFEAA